MRGKSQKKVASPSEIAASPENAVGGGYQERIDDDDHESYLEPSASPAPRQSHKSWWKMPELLDIEFGQEVWKAKAREYSIERLFAILCADGETDSDLPSEFV
jgi:hypothetical protein